MIILQAFLLKTCCACNGVLFYEYAFCWG